MRSQKSEWKRGVRWTFAALVLGLSACLPVTGDDGGPSDGGQSDGAPNDAAPTDAAPTDAAPHDAAPHDAAPADAGPADAGPTDAGPTDAGPTDGSPTDAVPMADGAVDGAGDAAAADGAAVDACGMAEACNGEDDDCDGQADEGLDCPGPGSLDPTFGVGGIVLEALGDSAEVRDLKADPQGRVWLGGAVYMADTGWDMLAARLTPEGDLDPAFSGDGWAAIDFAGGADQAFGVALGDALVLAGFRTDGTANPALARVTVDGDLDPAFSGGRVSPAGFASGSYRAVEITPTGLLAAGETRAAGEVSVELVARHAADGALEGGSLVELGEADDVRVRAVALLADGTVAFAGQVEAGADDDGFLARLPARGDPIFQRIDAAPGESRERILDLVPTAQGYLMVGEADGDLLLVHVDAAGMPVAGFGNNGRVVLDIGGGRDRAVDAVIEPSGRITLAGRAEVGGKYRFLVMRLTPGGAVDPMFGDRGRVMLDFDLPNEDHEAHALALTGQHVVVAGAAGNHGARRLAVVRLTR